MPVTTYITPHYKGISDTTPPGEPKKNFISTPNPDNYIQKAYEFASYRKSLLLALAHMGCEFCPFETECSTGIPINVFDQNRRGLDPKLTTHENDTLSICLPIWLKNIDKVQP